MILSLRRLGLCVVIPMLLRAGPAFANPLEGADYKADVGLKLTSVIAPANDDAGEVDAEVALYAFALTASGNVLLENGLEIGLRFRAEAQRDHPARAGFTGRIGAGLQAGDVATDVLADRNPFTGLTLGGPLEDIDVRGAVERAQLYLKAGYGEISLGRDQGVAAKFFRGAPDVFTHARTSDPRLDQSGVSTLRTRADLTGPAFKVSYTTPRLIGIRAGISYTPEANVRGVDRDPERTVEGVETLDLDNGVELAVNVSRRIGKEGPRARAYVSYARADVTSDLAPTSTDVNVVGLGGSLAFEHIRLGGSWLLADSAGDTFRAWSIGAGGEVAGFDWSANFGRSRHNLADIDGQSWSIGVRRDINDHFGLALGLQRQSLEPDGESDKGSLGPVIEMTLEF